MAERKSYSELLRDPRWQKKRLTIMQRDDFACNRCGTKDRTLNVHHTYYVRGANPWDYPDEDLQTLCEECHGRFEGLKDDICRILNRLSFEQIGEMIVSVGGNPKPQAAEIQREEVAGVAPAHERELVQVLLSKPELIAQAFRFCVLIQNNTVHSGIDRMLKAIFKQFFDTREFCYVGIRSKLDDQPELQAVMDELRETGSRSTANAQQWLDDIIQEFHRIETRKSRDSIKTKLASAGSHAEEIELLRRLQSGTPRR